MSKIPTVSKHPLRNDLPNIFPRLGAVTKFVLLADFAEIEPPPLQSWEKEGTVIIRHGLAGIALRLARERSLPISSDTLRQLELASFHDMATTMTVVKQSQEGIGHLKSARIPFVVTKGPGIALQGKVVSDRAFIDLDIVVEYSRFTDAYRILQSNGYLEKPSSRQAWDFFNRFCREAVNLRNVTGGSIDLHHRISPWFWSVGLTFPFLRKEAQDKSIFGVTLPLVSPEHNILVTALHIVSDKSRPGQTYRVWRDLLVLAQNCSIDGVVNAAVEAGLSAWLVWILGCLPLEVQPVEMLEALVDRQEKLSGDFRLRMLLPPRFGSQHVFGQVFRIPAPNAVLFAAGMLIPSPEFLRIRYPDEMHRYLAWWRTSFANYHRESRNSQSSR